MTYLTRIAPAKINLTLQVGPRDHDGYHNLHSLVVFAAIGDRLSIRTKTMRGDKPQTSLRLDGPFAHALKAPQKKAKNNAKKTKINSGATSDNLVLRASQIFDAVVSNQEDVDFVLQKNLPIASGIGGGSADAAAAIKLRSACGHSLPSRYMDKIYAMGSDIAVCLSQTTCLMQGRGEKLRALAGAGRVACVLVNPGGGLSTGDVFAAFDAQGKASNLNEIAAEFMANTGSVDLLSLARSGRNDLQASAIGLYPEIGQVLEKMSQQNGCDLARMSGSGATCFGLFANTEQAERAAKNLSAENPNWWCVATELGGDGGVA